MLCFVICRFAQKKVLKKKCVNDNGGVNDDNADSDSSEQDICGISSDDLMIFSH